MAYIESHQSLPRHPKTMRAVELLKMDRHKFLGHLQCMWLWALDYADIDGNLPPTVTEQVLGMAAEIDHKQAKKFADALLNAGGEGHEGFLTWSDDHFVLHDWFDFVGRLIAKRVSNRERMRSTRGMHVQRTDAARAIPDETHVTGQRTINVPSPSPSPKPSISLPEWINPDYWYGFLEMRKAIKKPVTERGKALFIAKMEQLRSEGQDVNKCLDQSTMNSWQGIFPLKNKGDEHARTGGIKREYTDEERQAAIGAPLR